MQLEAAYRRTRYEVLLAGCTLVLRIDQLNPGLLAAQRRFSVSQSAVLTAWNPLSVVQAAAQNAAAQERLRARLAALQLECWPGWNRDPTGAWPDEPSLFVPGLDRGAARALGAEFGQHAVVHAAADAVPRLLWVTGPGASAGSGPPAAPGTATSDS